MLPKIPSLVQSVPVALNAPHRAAHSRALPEAAGQEHAAHPDLPARRLRFRTLQGKPGRRVPARRVAAQVSRSVPHRMHSRASTGQSTGHAWLALGALCCPKRHEPEQASGAPARVASHRRLEWCCTEWCCTACAACGHLTPRSTVLLPCEHCALTTRWLPDETLIAIASENNLSETAFVVSYGEP